MAPATVNVCEGAVVPMPTLPVVSSIVNLVVLSVLNIISPPLTSPAFNIS